MPGRFRYSWTKLSGEMKHLAHGCCTYAEPDHHFSQISVVGLLISFSSEVLHGLVGTCFWTNVKIDLMEMSAQIKSAKFCSLDVTDIVS